MHRAAPWLVLAVAAGIAACGTDDAPATGAGGGAGSGQVIKADPSDVPLKHATPEERLLFEQGDGAFDEIFHDADGAGPLYIRRSCGECHEGAARGPGNVQKMWVTAPDGTPAADQSLLAFGHTVRPFTVGDAEPISPPDDPSVRVVTRMPPSVFGRGYVEAVADASILAVEAAQKARTDGIHGRVHHVAFQSKMSADPAVHQHAEGEILIGRFGVKGRIATLDDFTADAYQGDMGVTSPLRPVELPNPSGLVDDEKPGLDVDLETVRRVAGYMRLLEIPPRASTPGAELFDAALCSVCHVPMMRTRADHPIAALRDLDAPVFTDLLLHDMGAELSDGAIEGEAGPRDFRTAPLIGLRFVKSYLHDGRAKTLADAVVAHGAAGSEAAGSAAAFLALSEPDRTKLLAYLGSL